MTLHLESRLAVDEPLARAVIYRFVSELFEHPTLAARTWGEWRRALAISLETCAETGTSGELAALFEQCVDAGTDRDGVACDYERIIGPTPRAGAVPYETEWLGAAGDLLQFHQISDIAAFYRAFGLELDATCHERADHISIELAFLHFLCVKESWAADRGETELRRATRDAERRFLDEHLARWAPAFCERLARWSERSFYARGAAALRGWLDDECRRFGISPGDPTLAPGSSSLSLDDCCVGCGKSSACRGSDTEADEHDDAR